MKNPRALLAWSIAGASLIALTGCSINAVVWGSDGARVIDTTEQLIAMADAGGQDALACEDSAAVFGDALVWDGLSAGEPERSDPKMSIDALGVDATWMINLEGLSASALSGAEVPTDVFYRETETGLCVADVIWQTIEVHWGRSFGIPGPLTAQAGK